MQPAPLDPVAARQFATEIVQTLRSAGHESYWAGGCVRDEILGKVPVDYDVATAALPEKVRDLFGRRRTLAIGVAFGVITVLGPREAGHRHVRPLHGRTPHQALELRSRSLDRRDQDVAVCPVTAVRPARTWRLIRASMAVIPRMRRGETATVSPSMLG